MKYIVTTTDVYRVESMEEVEQLHKELLNSRYFTLASFKHQTKYKKEKGEIVDEWQQVTAKKIFNDEKEPDRHIALTYEVDY